MIFIIKLILFIWGINKLYKAITKEDFGCLYDATLLFAFFWFIQPII